MCFNYKIKCILKILSIVILIFLPSLILALDSRELIIFENKTISFLFTFSQLPRMQKYLLLAIALTGLMLVTVLFILIIRFFFKKQNTDKRSKEPVFLSFTQDLANSETITSVETFETYEIPGETSGMSEISQISEISEISEEIHSYKPSPSIEVKTTREAISKTKETISATITNAVSAIESAEFVEGKEFHFLHNHPGLENLDNINSIGNLDSLDINKQRSPQGNQFKNEMSLRLDLAQTYLEMQDKVNAKMLLEEVILLGSEVERDLAEKIFIRLS